MRKVQRISSVIRHVKRIAGLALILLGCGVPAMRGGELYAGRPTGEPSLEILPDPDIVDEALTPTMREALELAGESFRLGDPPPPPDRRAMELMAWSNQALRPWLERKSQAVHLARRALDQAAEENHRQRIIGGAVVGMLYEDLAAVIRSVPEPTDLQDEPEILAIYGQLLESQARPYLQNARQAYRACALNAAEPRSMHHWAEFCWHREGRLEMLDPLESGETRVEVLVR